MLDRNKIFETVRNTTDTLNVSTNRKMDNFYTEMMKYESMVEKRYNRIKDVLATITYHHNKIKNLQTNYNNAIFGGGGNKNLNDLLKKIEDVIDSLDKLKDDELKRLESVTTIDKKIQLLKGKEILNSDASELEYTKITEDDIILLSTEKESLQSLERLFDKDIAGLDAILKKIEEIKDPVTEYIRENKQLSRDLIDKLKNGIKVQKQTIEEKKSNIKKKFGNYKTIILSGDKYAKKAETDNKDETKDIDKKILQVFVRSPEKLQFKVDISKESGTLSLNRVTYPFEILKKFSNDSYTYFKIKMDNTDIQFYLFFNKSESSIKKTTTALTKNYCIDITSLFTILQDSRLSPLFKNFKDLILKVNDDKIKTVIDTSPSDINSEQLNKLKRIGDELYKKKILDSNYLLLLNTSYDYESNHTKSSKNDLKSGSNLDYEVSDNHIPEETIKSTDLQKYASAFHVLKQKDSFYPNPPVTGGGDISEDFKKTLNIIKKHISENIDKEYNKTEDKKQNDSTNTIKSGEATSNNQTKTKLSDSIISSIIQNYEKERGQINTIEEKIRLDTKFIDLLDNLGLNLSDIFKVTFDDKLAFIFFILVLHIIVYSIIESLIINDYITDIVYIMGTYVGVYFLLMFITILILNKFVSYKLKSVLNYINIDFNMQLITMHLFIVFMFYLVVLILSQHIDIFKAEDEDDKLQILYRIEVISSIIFIFSSVFVMIL